jgi:hypothetical protein
VSAFDLLGLSKEARFFGILRTRQWPFEEVYFVKKALPQNAKPSKLLCVLGALCG